MKPRIYVCQVNDYVYTKYLRPHTDAEGYVRQKLGCSTYVLMSGKMVVHASVQYKTWYYGPHLIVVSTIRVTKSAHKCRRPEDTGNGCIDAY